jgi:amidase
MTSATATDIAAGVRSGERTAVHEVATALQRIQERDRDLDAFAVVRTEQAHAEAQAIDARSDRERLPLAGVPVAIKDNISVAGEPMRVGSLATNDEPQSNDHPVVQRIRNAGGVIVGITRVPELCVFGATDSRYGVTRNPWDLGRTPGGSSGGSAAAVAAGMVSIAHGNDGMGSIRIPAACTGLVGIKPGRGVVPAELGETDWYGMSENGPLATTVADAGLLLSVMADRPDLQDVSPHDGRVRVALSHRPPVAGVTVDPAWAAAAERIAAIMRMDGHDVRRANPVYPTSAAIAGLARWFAGTAADADQLDDDLLEARIRRHASIGRAIRKTPLMSERLRTSWITRAREFLNEYDILITPALAQPPLESRRWSDGGWAATMLANIRYAPFAAPWNVAGFPAMVVPAGVHPDTGTPVAVQLVAGPGGEHLLLRMAAAIEQIHPWQRTAPQMV